MIKIYFSHRPKAGISIGASRQGNQVVVATAFTNKKDKFSRPNARRVIAGRLESGKQTEFMRSYPVNDEFVFGKFMTKLRQKFKPDYTEPDAKDFTREHASIDRLLQKIDNMVRDSI